MVPALPSVPVRVDNSNDQLEMGMWQTPPAELWEKRENGGKPAARGTVL